MRVLTVLHEQPLDELGREYTPEHKGTVIKLYPENSPFGETMFVRTMYLFLKKYPHSGYGWLSHTLSVADYETGSSFRVDIPQLEGTINIYPQIRMTKGTLEKIVELVRREFRCKKVVYEFKETP